MYYQIPGEFTEDIFKALRLIRHEKDFTDVTLVCKDDMLVRAHRVILASASSFFKAALLRKKVVRQRRLGLAENQSCWKMFQDSCIPM